MKKLITLLIMIFSLAITQEVSAQERTVSGTVTAASDGLPLPGVNIVVKGTAKGSQTDFNGKYTMDVSKGDVLIFSFMGMASKSITVNDSLIIDVILNEDAQSLNEIVVTALGIKKEKKALGYSVTDVKADDLQMAKDPNVVNSLQGKVSGLQINQAAAGVGSANRLIIRGNSSLLGNNQALYVVDGVPISNSEAEGNIDEWGNGVSLGNGISDINPDDIESVSVLKGANAAALYGARASNGVIMITTKKGKSGKFSFGLNSAVTFDKVAYLPDFQNTYGQGSYGAIPTDGSLRNFSSWGPKLDGSNQLLWTGKNGTYSSQPDNVKDFFDTGVTLTNSIYIDGGSENLISRIGYTRSDITGTIPNNDLSRNSFSVYSKLNFNSKFSAEAKVNYINQEVENRPFLSIWPDNIVNSLYGMPRNVSLTDLEANTFNPLSGSFNNPYNTINTVGSNDKKNRVFGYASLNYSFSDNLKGFVRAGTDYSNQSFLSYVPVGHPTIAGGQVTQNNYTNQETNIDFLLSYSKKLTEKINLGVNLGGNTMKSTSSIAGGIGNGLQSPGIYNVNNASSYQINAGTGDYERKVNSLYATTDIDYNNYLFLQLTARNDWSSVLPQSNNSFFYPSVSLSSIITEMADIKSDLISYWKVRASWAKVGSDGDIGPYEIHSRYLSAPFYLGNGTLTTPSTKPNPNIKPQSTYSYELGTDLKLLNSKLTVDLSIYNTKTEDQIIELPAPVESGYTSFLLNEGSLTNKGFELGLNYKLINNEDLKWELGVNFSKNKSEVSDLSTSEIPLAPITGGTSFRILAYNNGNYGDIVGYGYKRDDSGNILVSDSGLPLQSDQQQSFGNFNPDWIGGLSNTLSYKNVSLRFLLSAKFGGQILSRTDMILDVNGNSKRTLANRETGIVVPNSIVESSGEANTTTVPVQDYFSTIAGGNIIEDYVYDADYVKFKELSISYKIPKSLTDKFSISNASISLIGRNLFFLHRKTDSFDPEVSGYNTRNAQGIELLSLPGTRSYGLNLSVNF